MYGVKLTDLLTKLARQINGRDDKLRDRLEAVEREVEMLRGRVAQLEARMPPPISTT